MDPVMKYATGPWRRLRQRARARDTEWSIKTEQRRREEHEREERSKQLAIEHIDKLMENDELWHFDETRGCHQFVFARSDLPTSLAMNDATFDSLTGAYDRAGQLRVTERDSAVFRVDLISEESPLDACVTLAEKLADASRPVVTLSELQAYSYYLHLTTGKISAPNGWLTEVALPLVNSTRSLECIDKEEWLQ